MQRAVPSKRTAARLAAATFGTALVLGSGATLASASTHPSARSAFPGFTVKVTATDEASANILGAEFHGHGVVMDETGGTIGTIKDTCDDVGFSPVNGPTALCHTVMKFDDGSTLEADVEFPVINPMASFTGLVTEATGTYSGVRGIHIQTVAPRTYHVSFPSD